jgi:phosphoribosylformimino-5-aminoimidazole carboxamide ribotide isomerase
MNASTTFGEDPAAMARRWLDAGARRLHLVDLNGAFAGKPVNEAPSRPSCARWATDPGAARRRHPRPGHHRALPRRRPELRHHRHRRGQEPGLPEGRLHAFGGHIIVGLDAKDGKVATDGWSKLTGHEVVDLAKKFEDYGVEGVIYTDIGRDGMLTGINIDATVKLARR